MSYLRSELKCDVVPFVAYGNVMVNGLPSTCVSKQRAGFGDSVRPENLTASFHDSTMDCLRSIYNSYGVTYTQRLKNLKKTWSLSVDDNGLEEELYFWKNFGVQSIRSLSSPPMLKRIYTLDENIIDFFPVHFIVDEKEITDYHYEVLANTIDETEDFEHLFSSGFAKTIPLRFKIRKGEDNTTRILKRKRALCAVDKNSLRIFCEDGDFWDKQLDFQIRSIVRSDYGILLERSLMKLERDVDSKFILYPTVYTISHFHGDVCPVWKVMPKDMPSANHYFSRLDQMELLEFLESEDIAVFYSRERKTHMFFYMRPVNNEELEMMNEVLHRKRKKSAKDRLKEELCLPGDLKQLLECKEPNLEMTTIDVSRNFSTNQSFNQSFNHSSSVNHHHNSNLSTNLNSNLNNLNIESPKSPFMSTIMTRSRSQRVMKSLSDLVKRDSGSSLSKFDSWSVNPMTLGHESNFINMTMDTKSIDPVSGNLDFHSIRVNNSMNDINEMSLSLKRLSVKSPNKIEGKDGDSPEDIEVFGILPEYCLVYFGTEYQQSDFVAEKCFSMVDLMGVKYICLLTKDLDGQCCLRLMTYVWDAGNGQPKIGHKIGDKNDCLQIMAKDAEPVKSLRMLLVLDHYDNVLLYSGTSPICVVSPNVMGLGTSECLLGNDNDGEKEDKNMNVNDYFFKTPKLTKRMQKTIVNQSSFFNTSNSPSSLSTTLSSSVTKINHATKSSTPKFNISTPLPSNKDSMDDSLSMNKPIDQVFIDSSTNFSPVSTSFLKPKSSGNLNAVVEQFENVIGNDVVFKTVEGEFCRFSLPELAEDFVVKQCFAALLQTLDERLANDLVSAWYSFRNQHLKVNEDCELILFKICILKLIGYEERCLMNSHPSFRSVDLLESVKKNGKNKKSLNKREFKGKVNDEEEFEDFQEILRHSRLPFAELFGFGIDDKDRDKGFGVGSLGNSLVKFDLRFEYQQLLFEHLPSVLQTLHLVYEDFKLANSSWQSASDLADLLYLLACDLKLDVYCQFYKKDFPDKCPEEWFDKQRIDLELCFRFPDEFPLKPFSVYERLEEFFSVKDRAFGRFDDRSFVKIPFIGCDRLVQEATVEQSMELITVNIFRLVFLFANLSCNRYVRYGEVLQCFGHGRQSGFGKCMRFNGILVKKIKTICIANEKSLSSNGKDLEFSSPLLWTEKILYFLVLLKIDSIQLQNIPIGISTPILIVLCSAKRSPKTSWPTEIYKLLDRYDLILQDFEKQGGAKHFAHKVQFSELTFKNNFVNSKHPELNCFDQETLQLMFPEDQRIQDAFELLVSSKPVIIKCKQSHGVSDTDFLDQQEKILSQITPRTQAKCIGRGMVTLNTFPTVWHERFDIPALCLTGQSESYKTAIELANFDSTTNYWPVFHNGCAAGLRIRSDGICDPSWIQFNKPKANAGPEELIKHAGFLFAMGLNGMMPSLQIINVYDYLSNNNDFTNVAVMLGLAAARRGSSDNTVFKILSLRLECLLPSTCTDLEISPMCRTASCMGLGLLFQGTGNSFIVEVLLNDIGKPPGPEMENYMDRESYSLTAGIALGMVTLGKGSTLDPYISPDGNTIPVQLNHYMQGAHKKSTCISREHLRPSSFHVQEGMVINSNVTSPGATLALGLMYFNCNNAIISSWMKVPETQILLEYIRPDFLFLRMISHSLINWGKVQATKEWILSHFPKILLDFFVMDKEGLDKMQDFDRPTDYKLLGQCFCNILAGVCFSLALKFAGSHNLEAYGLVYGFIQMIFDCHQAKVAVPYLTETGKFTMETTVNSLLISCSIIMSGSGNIDILRLCRFLHYRTARDLTYGNFMAVHMALGLNFLGSGKLTLNNSLESLPLLIMAFYPKFPSTTTDNRYHLQLFRHLYVLAVEPRLLLAKSVDLKSKVYANIKFTFKDPGLKPLEAQTPCQVPQLDQLSSIEICDANFWNVTYSTPGQMKKIRNVLRRSGILFVKQRLNTLVYSEKELFQRNKSLRERFLHLHMPKSADSIDHINDSVLKRFFLRFVFNKSSATEKEFSDTRKLYRLVREFLDDETFAMVLPFLELLSTFCSLMNMDESDEHCFRLPADGRLMRQKALVLWQMRFLANCVQRFDDVPPKVAFLYSMANRFVDSEI